MNRRHFIQSALGAVTLSKAMIGYGVQSPLKVAIIGHTGRGNYGHGLDTLWINFPGIVISAIADRESEGLKKAATRLNNPKTYTDYVAMLQKENPDLLCVAPRHIDQHRDMILAGIDHGVKGIYVEKPFCRNLHEAAEIIKAAEKSGTKIALAHRNRYHPVLPKVQQLIDSGIAGNILEIKMRGKEDQRGGPQDLWVLGSHVLNLAPLFSGKLLACNAMIYQDNEPIGKEHIKAGDEGVGPVGGNRLHARFESEKGIPVYFDSIKSYGTSDANFGMQIIGTQGIFDIRIDTEPLVHFLPSNINKPRLSDKEWLPVSSLGIQQTEPVKNINQLIEGHHAAVIDLFESIKDNRMPVCNMYEGRDTIEAIMGVFESHRQNGQRVLLSQLGAENPLLYL